MRRTGIIGLVGYVGLGLVLAGMLATIGAPVGAVTYGQPDGDGHPYVGIVRFFDEGGAYLWRCSGTLLSPTVFLTAGHCTGSEGTETPARAAVWFTPTAPATPADTAQWTLTYFTTQVAPPASLGTPHPHPLYDDFAGFPNTHDVGVVTLDTPVVMDHYGQLPAPRALDAFLRQQGKTKPTFTTVGYGLQQVRPKEILLTQRWVGESGLVNLRSALTDGYNIQLQNNAGQGWGGGGGSCFGDSGGPLFFHGSNVVAAIVSFGQNANCKGVDFDYRADIAETQDFVTPYL
jgi:hypothetical protein